MDIYNPASLGFLTFYLGYVKYEIDVGTHSNRGFSCLIMCVMYAFCGGYKFQLRKLLENRLRGC